MNAMERIFSATAQLPVIPRVVQKMIDTLKHENADLQPLIADIRLDPVISARVLRIANSGFYGSRRTIGSIEHAVTLVGTRVLRTLVISAGVSSAFPKVPGVDLKDFWRHALMTASANAMLARHAGEKADNAYVAGLMHRLGQLMIHIAFPRLAEEIARDCHHLSVSERAAVEQLKVHTNHCEVGAELAARWNFPDDVARAMQYYCQPHNESATRLARLTNVAAQIAMEIDDDVKPEDIAEHLNRSITDLCGLDRTAILPDIEYCAEHATGAELVL
ncbi:MAG: HDOD domain-containing protein [Methyloversatilis sp.]|uniref:HDOD domain-containing protein n=1 Tax=Methyloversatilis sp. TaxID=2569862 RepID=UPI00273503F8|nr:HDOD domain-containing protein [Methyloversatilis sp.]MDP3873640.1 HDOD domain-containing protein [Methyloversatilis sp.]